MATKPSPLAALLCPKCFRKIPEQSASIDNIGIFPTCDTVLELREDSTLRIVDEDELQRFDLAVRSAIVQEHLDLELDQILARRGRRYCFNVQ